MLMNPALIRLSSVWLPGSSKTREIKRAGRGLLVPTMCSETPTRRKLRAPAPQQPTRQRPAEPGRGIGRQKARFSRDTGQISR